MDWKKIRKNKIVPKAPVRMRHTMKKGLAEERRVWAVDCVPLTQNSGSGCL